MTQLSQLISEMERLWPLANAEAWDAPGLVTGSPETKIAKVLLTVDVTAEVVEAAIEQKVDLLLAHHPFLLKGISSVSESAPKGRVLASAIRSNLAIYAAHTNADVVNLGVSDSLATAFGLQGLEPLVAVTPGVGSGRVGTLAQPLSLLDFARNVAKILPATATGIRVSGNHEQLVQRVALCAGAGDSFIQAAFEAGADVYLTSDVRHHPASDVREQSRVGKKPMALIDTSHWASEWIWLDQAAKQLSTSFPELEFLVSDIRTDPWDFVVTQ